MMQMIETLKQQIQQIIALIAQLKPQETCGNGKCRFGETAATCPADCATETCVKEGGIIDWRLPRTPECCTGLTKILDCSESNCSKSSNSVCTYCGNGICGAGENSYNCPADCNTTACTAEGRTKSMSMPDCCAGLKSILNQIPAGDGTCGGVPNDGSVICANCGNGICGAGENKCNCPADCGQITACAKEGVIVLPYQSCCAGLARIACSGNYCHDNGSGICAKCGNGICGLGEAAANCPADCFGAKTCYSEGEGETGEVGLTAGITIPCCSGLYPNGTQAVTGGFICRKLIADFNNTKPDTVVNCKKEGELFGYLEGECCDGLLKVYPDGAKTYSFGESQNFQVTCKKPAN
jgi:hypothetical protein